jgi:hypothetical protein
MVRRRLLCVVLLGMLMLPAGAQPPTPADGENPFGIVEGMWFAHLSCDLGVSWERIIFDWGQHQPSGPDDWNTLNVDDRWLRAASDCQREVVAVIKNVPAWATDGTPGVGVPRGLDLPLDDAGNLWASFMRRAAAYYAPRGVHRFIILNEPDIDRETYGFEFEGGLEDYAAMLRVAYHAVRQGNPAARVHLAGTTFWHDIQSGRPIYLSRLLEHYTATDPQAAAHGFYFDALSLHIYFRSESMPVIVGRMRDLLDRYGLTETPIWVNETNTSPNLDPAWPVTRPQFQVTLAQQQAYLVQAVALALASGVERLAVYKLWDQNAEVGIETFGLLTPNTEDRQPRPAYYTYRAIVRHFRGVEHTAWAVTPQVYALRLTHADDRHTLVVWARTAQSAAFQLTDAGSKGYRIGLDGTLTRVNPTDRFVLEGAQCDDRDGCAVGGVPVILALPPHAGSATLTLDGQALPWQTGQPPSSVVIDA